MGKTILTTNQHKLLDSIAKNREITERFYFTGGTALAEYYLQHRLSEDLDFFSFQPFDPITLQIQIKNIAESLRIADIEHQSLNGQEIYYFNVESEKIKVDFAYFPFEHIGTFKKMQDLKVSSIEDIAVNKIQAIISRKRARDYFDLYEIISANPGLTVAKLMELYQVKFEMKVSVDELAKHFLGVLDAADQPRFLGEVEWSLVEKFFVEKAKQLQPDMIQ